MALYNQHTPRRMFLYVYKTMFPFLYYNKIDTIVFDGVTYRQLCAKKLKLELFYSSTGVSAKYFVSDIDLGDGFAEIPSKEDKQKTLF